MKLHTNVKTIIGCAEHKNHNSGLHTLLIIAHTPVSVLYLKNHLRYFREILYTYKAMIGMAEHKNHNSGLHTLLIIAL